MENVGNFVGGGDRAIGCGMKFILRGEGERFAYMAGEERL
jgi:hypothetical protein